MSEKINPLVVDLSHFEWPCDFGKIAANGYVGVIWKATQGSSYTDPTYKDARKQAKAVGLSWGAYHFGDSSDTDAQSVNFLSYAQPEVDELFCLDWEPNGNSTMGVNQAQNWITAVEAGLNRTGECVLYSGNQAKESIHGKNAFLGERRLWLAQYGTTPSCQESWSTYWLWQFTDGSAGPTPHEVNGVSGGCDINSYASGADQLVSEWASGKAGPAPAPAPVPLAGTVIITAPANVKIVVNPVKQTTVGDTKRKSQGPS